MKKIFLFSLLFIFIKSSYSQDEGAGLKNFRFGVKGSPTISWAKPEDSKVFGADGARFRFGYGLVTEFKLNKVVSFNTGIEFNSYGAKFTMNDTTMAYIPNDVNPQSGEAWVYRPTSRAFKVNYLELPICLKMRTPEVGGLTYFANFGFNLGFRGKAIATDQGTYVITKTKSEIINGVAVVSSSVSKNQEERKDLNISKDFSPLRLGLNVGAGVEYNLAGSTCAFASIHYLNGFTNTFKGNSRELKVLKNNSQTAAETIAKLSGVMITVGIMF